MDKKRNVKKRTSTQKMYDTGPLVKQEREKLGWSQQYLALMLRGLIKKSTSANYIAQIEKGRIKAPDELLDLLKNPKTAMDLSSRTLPEPSPRTIDSLPTLNDILIAADDVYLCTLIRPLELADDINARQKIVSNIIKHNTKYIYVLPDPKVLSDLGHFPFPGGAIFTKDDFITLRSIIDEEVLRVKGVKKHRNRKNNNSSIQGRIVSNLLYFGPHQKLAIYDSNTKRGMRDVSGIIEINVQTEAGEKTSYLRIPSEHAHNIISWIERFTSEEIK